MCYKRTLSQIDILAKKIMTSNLKDKVIREQINWSFKTLFPSDSVRLVTKLHTMRSYGKAEYKGFSFHKLIDLLEGN